MFDDRGNKLHKVEPRSAKEMLARLLLDLATKWKLSEYATETAAKFAIFCDLHQEISMQLDDGKEEMKS